MKINPKLQSFPGWDMDTTQIKDKSALPSTMDNYINFINNFIGAPIKFVSNGPGRDQIIHL